MIALYLVAQDQAALETALVDAGVAQWVEQPIYPEPEVIINEDGTTTTVGNINAEPTGYVQVFQPVQGYSVDTIGFAEGYVGYMCNLLGEFTDEQLALLPVIPFPAAPLRIFGGWDNGEAPKLIVSEVA
jgi:hypothetical protein